RHGALAPPLLGGLFLRGRALHMNFGALVVRADRIGEFLCARVAAMNGGWLFPIWRRDNARKRIARPRADGEGICWRSTCERIVRRGPCIRDLRFVRLGGSGRRCSLLGGPIALLPGSVPLLRRRDVFRPDGSGLCLRISPDLLEG